MKNLMKCLAGVALLAILFSAPALGDTPVSPVARSNGCKTFTLCSAETDTTAACDDGTDNLVAEVSGHYVQTLYATQSTATTFTCHLFSSDNGYHATVKEQITLTPLSESQYVVTIEGPLEDEWIECSAISGGNVTVTTLACPVGG